MYYSLLRVAVLGFKARNIHLLDPVIPTLSTEIKYLLYIDIDTSMFIEGLFVEAK